MNKNVNNKIFELRTKEQYILFLRYLIQLLAIKLRRFNIYIFEMEAILPEYVDLKTLKEQISNSVNTTYNVDVFIEYLDSDIYDQFMDKTNGVGLGILNLFADETKDTVSYANFKKRILKTNFAHSLQKLELEYTQLQNSFRDFRNWSAHIPQSLINAQFIAEEGINKNAAQDIIKDLKEIQIPVFEFHHIKYLVSLYIGCYQEYAKFKLMFERIQKDYESLVEHKVDYNYVVLELRNEEVDIQELSYKMQQKKFQST